MIKSTITLFCRLKFWALFFVCTNSVVFGQQSRISKGDILEIQVYGHQELCKIVAVQPNGTVDYPLTASIPIDGLSLNEFADILKTQIAKYLGETPIVSVRFSQSIQVVVTVLGQVMLPGEYLVSKNVTVQGAITRAGGFTPRSQIERVQLIREKEGKREILSVDMHRFFVEGDPALLPSLEDGDIVVVPGLPGSNDVKIIGEVKLPGSYSVFLGATVLDVILMAGGPTPNAGLGRIEHISTSQQEATGVRVDLQKLIESRQTARIPVVKPGDVVFVPLKTRSFFSSTVNIVRGISSFLLPIAMVMYYYGYTRK